MRAQNPQSFMSNMLQAVSILYKTRLPLILVFNKIDVVRHETMQVGICTNFAVFQGTSHGRCQFLRNRQSNRYIVPLYGKYDRLFTRVRKFAQRCPPFEMPRKAARKAHVGYGSGRRTWDMV